MTDMKWISDNVAAFREAEVRLAEFNTKREEVVRRFHSDPEFHARVYSAARIVDRDVLAGGRADDDTEGQWNDALFAALATVAAFELLTPESHVSSTGDES